MKETISEKTARITYREPKVTTFAMDTSGVLCQSDPYTYGTDFGDTEDIF